MLTEKGLNDILLKMFNIHYHKSCRTGWELTPDLSPLPATVADNQPLYWREYIGWYNSNSKNMWPLCFGVQIATVTGRERCQFASLNFPTAGFGMFVSKAVIYPIMIWDQWLANLSNQSCFPLWEYTLNMSFYPPAPTPLLFPSPNIWPIFNMKAVYSGFKLCWHC